MKKKILAVLMSIMMIGTMVSPVRADETNVTQTTEESGAAAENGVNTQDQDNVMTDESELVLNGDIAVRTQESSVLSGTLNSAILSQSVTDTLSYLDGNTPASGCIFVGLDGTYYGDIQAALDRINEIRYEACTAGNVPDPRDSSRMLTVDDYVPIKWSGDLERIARIRASESILTRDHLRLNGDTWYSVYSNGIHSWGEILAWNGYMSDAAMINGINQWYGEKTAWVNQTSGAVTGHYTQMIDPSNHYIGLADFSSSTGVYRSCVAGEFNPYKSAFDETRYELPLQKVQNIEVLTDNCSNYSFTADKTVLGEGESVQTALSTDVTINSRTFSGLKVTAGVTYTSSDPSVATVDENGLIQQVGAGKTTISAIIGGTTVSSIEIEIHTEHDFSKQDAVEKYLVSAATCTSPAVYYYSCSVCGATSMDTYTYGSALGHSFTNYVSDNNKTCTKDGTKTAKCDRCDVTDTQIVPAGHVEKATDNGDGTHAITCSVCGTVISENIVHFGGTATYTERAKCEICGAEYGELLAVASGTCGDNVAWVLNGTAQNGYTLTISGSGEMYDYSYQSTPWNKYLSKIVSISVENGVTRIGNDAFFDCTALTNVSLPESLLCIGGGAFGWCTKLTSVTLPQSLTSIERLAFSSCISMTSISFPNGVTTISEGILECCSSLTNVTLPECVTSIESTAFIQCTNLKSLTIPSTVTEIDDFAFGMDYDHESGHWILSPSDFVCYGYSCSAAETYCKNNNIKFSSIGDAHSWGQGTVTKTATETSEGEMTYTCSVCKEIKTETIPKLSHEKGTYHSATAATCISKGNIEYWDCKNCDQKLDQNGDVVDDVITALDLTNHVGETGTRNAVEATCTAVGYTGEIYCKACDTVLTERKEISALGHSWNTEYNVDIEATCTAAGSKSIHCSRCDAVKDVTNIEKLPHTVVTDAAVSATCTTAGKTEGSHCSVCNTVIKAQTTIPALGHSWETEYTVDRESTCTSAGSKSIHCSRCDAVKNVTSIEKLPHTVVTDKAVASTCTMAGKAEGSHCSVCNTVLKAQTSIPALGHVTVTDKAVAATCTKAGLTEGTHCSRCNTVLKAQETVAALGHAYKETKANGIITYTCTRCGDSYTEKAPSTVITTLSGAGRYETAADIARTAFPNGASEVVIVTGENFPDALSANAYAGAKVVPLLISNNKGGVPDAIRDLLVNSWGRSVKTVTFIGGGWKSQQKSELQACGVQNFREISGSTRIETAEAVCRAGISEGIFRTDSVVLATGNNPADALSMSTWCYKYHIPLLLADNKKLSDTTKSLASQFTTVYVAGGENCVPTGQITSAGIGTSRIHRLSGDDRFLTSIAVAEYFTKSYPGATGTYDGTCYACGENKNFPDALVGGMLAGQTGAPVILVNDNSSSAYEYSRNTVKSASPSTVYVLGAAANGSMYSQISASLR